MNGEFKFRWDELNLHSVFRDLVRNVWVIILAALSAWLCVSSYSTLTYVPRYTSTATVVISSQTGTTSVSSLNITMQLASVFAEVFQSDVLKSAVEEQLGDVWGDSRITTAVIPETNLMTVSVTSPGPEEAFRTLNLVLENYPVISEHLFGNVVMEVIKEPVIPMAPSNPNNSSQMKKRALVAGAVLPVLAILFLTMSRDTVQTYQAAKRKLDGEHMGTIGHEEKNKTVESRRKKKNVAALIVNPLISRAYVEAYHNLTVRVEQHMRRRDQKIILVGSAQENEGKSTISSNLALALASKNKKVLLLDCDFRKPALQKIFEVQSDPKNDFGRFLTAGHTDSEPIIYLKRCNLYLGVNQETYGSIQALVHSEKMVRFLAEQREKMDYIILDSPPMLVASDTEALAGLAETSLLVVRQDRTLARDINDCMDLVRQSCPDFAGYVLNDFRDQPKFLTNDR